MNFFQLFYCIRFIMSKPPLLLLFAVSALHSLLSYSLRHPRDLETFLSRYNYFSDPHIWFLFLVKVLIQVLELISILAHFTLCCFPCSLYPDDNLTSLETGANTEQEFSFPFDLILPRNIYKYVATLPIALNTRNVQHYLLGSAWNGLFLSSLATLPLCSCVSITLAFLWCFQEFMLPSTCKKPLSTFSVNIVPWPGTRSTPHSSISLVNVGFIRFLNLT